MESEAKINMKNRFKWRNALQKRNMSASIITNAFSLSL